MKCMQEGKTITTQKVTLRFQKEDKKNQSNKIEKEDGE